MTKRVKPRYVIDPVQVVPPFTFTEEHRQNIITASSCGFKNERKFIADLEPVARTYLWLRNQYRAQPRRREQNAALSELIQSSQHIARLLSCLDLGTQWELHRAGFPADPLQDLVDTLEDLAHAALPILRRGKQQTGPRRDPSLDRIFDSLARLYERYSGELATHNPYQKTEYVGDPQTNAGRFLVAFFKAVDPSVRKTQISTALTCWVRSGRNLVRA
jgi:hypothetical protein